MATDRTVRFLQALGGASTSRVLNLGQVARANRENSEHGEKPLFTSPILNSAFILKHRTRSDETYLFTSARSVVTKIIIPFDLDDLRAGAGVTVVTLSSGAEGATTARGGDIVVWTSGSGAYAGISFNGSVIKGDDDMNSTPTVGPQAQRLKANLASVR